MMNAELWKDQLLAITFPRPMNALQIGVGDGSAACWLLDNLLTFEDDRYYGMDQSLSEQARRNLSRFGERARLCAVDLKSPQQHWLPCWPQRPVCPP